MRFTVLHRVPRIVEGFALRLADHSSATHCIVAARPTYQVPSPVQPHLEFHETLRGVPHNNFVRADRPGALRGAAQLVT
jgi:hypothetical protein